MQHKVKLTNGQTVTLDEDNGRLAIGQLDSSGEDWWICTISRDGVLVAPNSSFAPEELTAGLQDGHEPPRSDKPEVWLRWGDEMVDQIDHYEFETLAELNAFLRGVMAAANCGGQYTQFDTLQEVEADKHARASEAAEQLRQASGRWTPNGYDPLWIQAINGVLEDRDSTNRITDLTEKQWETFIGPMIDQVDSYIGGLGGGETLCVEEL